MFEDDYGVQSYFGESGDCDFFGDTSMDGGFASGMGEAGFVSEAFAQDSMGGSFFTEASEFGSDEYSSFFTEGTEIKDDVKIKPETKSEKSHRRVRSMANGRNHLNIEALEAAQDRKIEHYSPGAIKRVVNGEATSTDHAAFVKAIGATGGFKGWEAARKHGREMQDQLKKGNKS